ncbi:hypothetical protein AYJ57_22615 (plasmid) [Salipiger sp. CCB-MM3]|nr:hypothetical protein AYJ57_22615 [Salipiger sp. CCB-MM3]
MLAAGFLSAASYGTYTLAIVFDEFVVMLIYTGFFHFVVNSDADDETLLSTLFWIMAGIGTFGGALLFIFAEPIADFFDAPDLAMVLRFFGIMQPFASMNGWAAAALTRAGLMKRYFLIMLVVNIGGVLAGCAVLALWQSLYGLIVYRAIRLTIGLVLFGWSVPIWPRLRFDGTLARQGLSFAAGLYGSRFLSFFSTFGTDLILAYLFTTAESGLYRFANRLAMASVDIVAQPMRSFAIKRFGEAGRTKKPLEIELERFLSGNVFLSGLVAVMLIILGASVIETLFRPEYLAAVGALQALAIRAAGLSGAQLIDPVFAARGTTRISMYFNLIWTTAMIAAIAIFSSMGYTALASAQAVVVILSSATAIYAIKRYGKVEVGAALRRTAAALGLIAAFAIALWLAWTTLSALVTGKLLLMISGIVVALVLAAVTMAVAVYLKVFDIRIFE